MSLRIDMDLRITRSYPNKSYADITATITGKDSFIGYVRCEWSVKPYNVSLSEHTQHLKVHHDSSGYFTIKATQRIEPEEPLASGYLTINVEMRDENYKSLGRPESNYIKYDFS